MSEDKDESTQDPKLMEATADILRQAVGQQVDEANDLELIDPETGEDPPAIKVAQEIAAHKALVALKVDWHGQDFFKKINAMDSMKDIGFLSRSLAALDPKTLGLVAMAERANRPFRLSDESWVYVLQVAAAHMEKKSKAPAFESLQGFLEPLLGAELKAKLRNKIGAGVVGETRGVDDEVVAVAVGKAYLMETDIAVTMVGAMMEASGGVSPDFGGSLNGKVNATLRLFADRLKAIDEKYGILGTQMHVVMVQKAVVDLSTAFRIAIIPVIKCVDDSIFEVFPYLKPAEEMVDKTVPKFVFPAMVGASVKPSLTLESESAAIEAFEQLTKTDEEGGKYIELADGKRQRVPVPPTAPQGVTPASFPALDVPVVNEQIAWGRNGGTENPQQGIRQSQGFFKAKSEAKK